MRWASPLAGPRVLSAHSDSSAAGMLPAPIWNRLADGSSVTRIEFVSPLAYGVRAGLRIEGLDPRAELRFAGSARPAQVVAVVRGAQVAGPVHETRMQVDADDGEETGEIRFGED